MKIKYICEDDLNTIKNNLNFVLKNITNDRKFNISALFDNKDIIKESSIEIDDFQLDMSASKGNEYLTDVENIQRVYNNMKFLSNSQASDERLWAAYTFSEFSDYMNYRWKPDKISDIENKYLFTYSHQRSLFRNGISRLWWIGKLTYDENRSDPYELTKFLCKDQDYIESFSSRNIFNNKNILIATISALIDAENAGVIVDRKLVRETSKYINLLAGTYILDALKIDDIYKKVCKKIGF